MAALQDGHREPVFLRPGREHRNRARITDRAERVVGGGPDVFVLVGDGFSDTRNGCGIAKFAESCQRVDAVVGVAIVEAIQQDRRGAAIAELAEDHAEVAADARIVGFRIRVQRGHVVLEVRVTFGLAALERFRELIGGLPALVRTAGADGVEVVGDALLLGRKPAEEEKDEDGDGDDAERKDDELEEDGFGRLFRDVD